MADAPGVTDTKMLALLESVNQQAAFNRWAGFKVVEACAGEVLLTMPWQPEASQYSGYLHAGVIAGLIDTACGFAAATLAGNVLVSHFSVNCMAPAVGELFSVRGTVLKAGARQIFARAELFAQSSEYEGRKLIATGEAVLVTVSTALAR